MWWESTIQRNRRRGLEAERLYEAMKRLDSLGTVEVERTGKGHDFYEKDYNPFTGKTKRTYVEHKLNDSPLSPLQEEKKRRYGGKYQVVRRRGDLF